MARSQAAATTPLHATRRTPRSTRKKKAHPTEIDPETHMLPPENPIEVAEPGSSGETVNQRRLREFYELQEKYYDLRSRYIAAYAKIQDLILTGADIQQGTYKVAYGVRLVRRPRYKQVVIDLKGEAYQQRVLEATQPHAHFRVKVN